MKNRSRILFAVALTLISSVTLWAQSQLLTNPANLSQFPSVERVKAEIIGSDAVDTAARQAAVLARLGGIAMAVSGSGTGMLVSSRDAGLLYSQYIAGLHSIDQIYYGRNPRWEKLFEGYKYDPQFGDEFMRRFFTADFRAGYYRLSGTQPLPPSAAGAPTAASKATAASEGIDRAKAAKVDTAVFGMQLGAPFTLSQCQLIGIDYITANCIVEGIDVQSLFGLPKPKSDADPEVISIRLAPDFRPAWVAPPDLSTGSDGWVRVHDGLLVGVYVLTKGRNMEKSITSELTAKYGPASGARLATITPDTGNPFKVSNPEWILPGIHVEYEVVQVIPNEDRVNLLNGVVRVETAAAYKRRMDNRSAPVKIKM
jgi:hypothetical protein